MTEQLKNMSISEIESYGSDLQTKISTEMGKIISSYKTVDAGSAGEQLTELSIVANTATNKLSKVGALNSIQKFMGRFDTVENKLEQIINGINDTKGKLDTVLQNMYDSRGFIKGYIAGFKPLEVELDSYIDELETDPTSDELRHQAALNRLKMLTTSRVTAEQSLIETTLLIGQTQEVQHQIGEMLTNIVPIFKMKLVNALSIKAHKEALDLKAKVTKISERLIIENAKNIEENTEKMLENRRSSIISPETLIEANEILQRVVEKTITACASESEANKEIINRLNNTSNLLRDKATEANLLEH